MKTKIISILALLLTVTQGAWAQVGRVLATDGKYYKTVTAATNAGTTASGMIVYWGDGDTSDNTYNQGLVIALSDVVNNGQWGAQEEDVTDITNTGRNAASSMVDKNGIANTNALVSKWPTGTYSYAADHCASMSTARPSSSSNWFLPSQGQFVLMMNSYGAGYGTSTSYEYNNTTKGAVVTAINNALTNAGGTALSNGRYWTSTEVDYKVAGDWSASNSSFGLNDKTLEQNVRAMFAFSGATAAEYTVSYNANGGSGAPDAQTKDGGIDLTLSSTQPTREGYTFNGWNSQADGSGTNYAAGAAYSANEDVTLYAQWTHRTTSGIDWDTSANSGTFLMPAYNVEVSTELWYKVNEEKTLDENIAAYGTQSDFFLNRTLKANVWNTFASPFAIAAGDMEKYFGAGAKVRQLESTSVDGTVLTLNFTDASEIVAGQPYLVKPAANVDFSADGKEFAGVNLNAATATPTETTYVNFIPTLGKTLVTGPEGDNDNVKAVLFLAAGNKLVNPSVVNDVTQEASYMKGFRAYFQVKGLAASARAFSMNLGDGETASISEELSVNSKVFAPVTECYTLDGRKLQGQPTQKGVYIVNGKKVIK